MRLQDKEEIGDEYSMNSLIKIKNENTIIIKNIKDFKPIHIFECGQCFRWHKQEDNSYIGVIGKEIFNIKKIDNDIIVKTNSSNPEQILANYFDLKRDYSDIKNFLYKDDILKKAINFGNGIRILKQDHWECLLSFIISANNRIPLIMRAIENISKSFGRSIEFNGQTYFSFPQPEELSKVEEDRLMLCGVGFRYKYIMHAVKMIKSGKINLNALEKLNSSLAREELMKIPGVGPKIADCVLLFSYGKTDVFPTDVWIKRVMEILYLKKDCKLYEIQEFVSKKFGYYAGFAQQYLYYYARENKIGSKFENSKLLMDN